MNRLLVAVPGLCAAFLLSSCGRSNQPAPTDPPAALTSDGESDRPLSAIDQATRNLEKGLQLRGEQSHTEADANAVEIDYAALNAAGENAAARREAAAQAALPLASDQPTPLVGPPAPADDMLAEAASTAAQDTSVATAPPPPPSRAELAAQLVEVVRRAIREDADPLQAALPLIGLGLVEPGVSEPEMRTLLEPLSPPEKATVLAVRELLAKVAAGELSSTDPKALAAALAAQRDALLEAAGVGLQHGTIALCSRVESFGQFTPLVSNRLLSGRANAAIAYTEVRGFAQRPTTDTSSSPGFMVELSQEIALYTDSDRPVLQWRIPEQMVRSFSRSERQDFYLVQRLDFPRTLAAGSYQLRIIVRDKNAPAAKSESNDAPAAPAASDRLATFEATIPIEVVADPALLRVPSSATVVGGRE